MPRKVPHPTELLREENLRLWQGRSPIYHILCILYTLYYILHTIYYTLYAMYYIVFTICHMLYTSYYVLYVGPLAMAGHPGILKERTGGPYASRVDASCCRFDLVAARSIACQGAYNSQRVHVGIWFVLGSKRGCYIMTLGPM